MIYDTEVSSFRLRQFVADYDPETPLLFKRDGVIYREFILVENEMYLFVNIEPKDEKKHDKIVEDYTVKTWKVEDLKEMTFVRIHSGVNGIIERNLVKIYYDEKEKGIVFEVEFLEDRNTPFLM